VKTSLVELFPRVSRNGIELLEGMLEWDQQRRFNVDQCMIHPYFYETPRPTSIRPPAYFNRNHQTANKKIKF
jgi:hypothetical protein